MEEIKPVRHKKRGFKIFLAIVALLIIIRLILPFIVLKYANKELARMPGYYGHVQDIDLSLIRGAYVINQIFIDKTDSTTGKGTPFFSSNQVDISIEWKPLLKGKLVGEMVFNHPVLHFTKEKVEPSDLAKDTNTFRKLLNEFMPLKVNRFEVLNGEIHYIDSTSKPVVNIQMDDTHILATNLTNAIDTAKSELPATVVANSNIYGGRLNFNMRIDPIAEKTRFDLNASLENTELPKLNDFFKAYAKVDVNRGTFGMYTEAAAKDGRIKGYVKPIIRNLDILGTEDRKESVFHQIWEAIVGTTADVFSNWSKDQFATKIPLEGRIDDPNTNIWSTVYNLLKNAFFSALRPSLDEDINLASVDESKPEEKKNIFQKVFGSGKEEKSADKNQVDKKQNTKSKK